ncbi:MAG: GNAT family N-acetyltransferase [Acidimicrobiales bacterium]
MPDTVVRPLEPEEHPAAAGVAARALRDAPSTVAMYGADPTSCLARLHADLLQFFAVLSVPQLGVVCGDTVIGVAAMAPPGSCIGSLMGGHVEDILGAPVVEFGAGVSDEEVGTTRSQIFWATWALLDPPSDHVHVGPVGVEPGLQNRGIGRAVMKELCTGLDDSRQVAWLEADKEHNVRFYGSLGFEAVEEVPILGVRTWFMRRDPDARTRSARAGGLFRQPSDRAEGADSGRARIQPPQSTAGDRVFANPTD